MQQSNLEQRNTKQIIEGFISNANRWSTYRGKRFFHNQAMFFGVSPCEEPNFCYEVKITRKKQRIIKANHKENVDFRKKHFLNCMLAAMMYLFDFEKIEMHDGKLVLHDELNDYTIELVRKIGLEWNNERD